MREMQRCRIDWSKIPQELLSKISTHLNSSLDFCSFRSVCKNWHKSSPFNHLLDSHLPLQIPFDSSIFKQSNSPIFLIKTSVYLLQPLHHTTINPWIVSVEELKPGKLHFHLPFTKNSVKNLPFYFPKTLNLSHLQGSCISEGFKLCFGNGNSHVFNLVGYSNCPIKVVVVGCSREVILALFSGGFLVCFRLQCGKWNSKRVNYRNGHCFDDIVEFKGKVCAIDRQGRVYIIDTCESRVSKAIAEPICTGVYSAYDKRKRLAVSCGELYLSQRRLDDMYEVYKLNEKQHKWDKVNVLGDRMLLVTCDDCFFVDAPKLPGFRGNCILFPEKHFTGYCSRSCCPTEMWFDEASKFLQISVFYLNEARSRLISSYPGLSDLFWPPPSWILADLLCDARETDKLLSVFSGPNCPIASEFSSMSSTCLQVEENVQIVRDKAQEDIPGQKLISWSNLPPELLLVIAQRLETPFDFIQFREVCKTWLQLASFSSLLQRNLLSLILPHKISTSCSRFLRKSREVPGESLILVASSVFILQSALNPKLLPWLFTVEELNPGKLYLRKPLSRVAIETLPTYFPKVLQLSHFRVKNIGRLYTLRFADNHSDMFSDWSDFSYKAVLLKSNCKTTQNIDDYSVIVLYDDGNLAAIRLGNEEHNHLISKSGTGLFEDIINFKGRIYAVDRKGRAYQIHNRYFKLEPVVTEPIVKCSGGGRRKRLAESCDELYLVHKIKCGFKVFKLDEEQKKWDEVEGIGDDRILFVTSDGCFFVPAKDLPGWRGNCIVYHRGCFPSYFDKDYGTFNTSATNLDISIFHFESAGCWLKTSYPAYFDVFWSLPTWLSLDKRSSKCVPEDQDEDRITQEPISKIEMSPTSLQVAKAMPNAHKDSSG